MGTRYDWAGSVVRHYPLNVGKRTLCVATADPIWMDMRDFITPPSRPEILDVFNILKLEAPTLERGKGTYDQRARRSWRFMVGAKDLVDDRNAAAGVPVPAIGGAAAGEMPAAGEEHPRVIRYVGDDERNPDSGVDFWQFPSETIARRCGDCEDLAILLASLMIGTGISPYFVRAITGRYRSSATAASDLTGMLAGEREAIALDRSMGAGGFSTAWAAHAWVAYKTEEGPWCLIDPTWDASMYKANGWHWADGCDEGIPDPVVVGAKRYYIPEVGFNNDHVWRIDPLPI